MSDDSSRGAPSAADPPSTKTSSPQRNAPLIAALAGVTALIYARMLGADFVNYDDGKYLYENPYLQFGLNLDTLRWAATTNYFSNWHPLTWLSYALDVTLFGVNATGSHAVNVLFHVANTALLFLFFAKATGSRWRSALVAALFALHPLHVESVAWIAERKDVLSTFFWLLTMLAYLRYVTAPSLGRYAWVALAFALGLMSKPMLVTLPLVLVLLDYWPLQRAELSFVQLGRRVLEKTPLLLLSAGVSALTYWAQTTGGSVISLETYSAELRAANALVAYASYIGNLFWPSGLAVIYPHPTSIPLARTLMAAALLAAVSGAALYEARRRPYLLVGWLWFIGTLVPVIGLLQVGHQAMADRYTYVPLIGLCVALAWGLGDVAQRWPARQRVLHALVAVAVLGLSAMTWQQLGYWQGGIPLYKHTLAVTEKNYLAHTKLAEAQADAGQLEEAIQNFQLSLRVRPEFANTHLNLGVALWGVGRHEQGLAHMVEAVKLDPTDPGAHVNLGSAYQQYGRSDEAIPHLEEAVRLEPGNVLGQFNLGQTLFTLGRNDEAALHLRHALAIDPNHAMSHNSLGAVLASSGQPEEGLKHFRRAAELDPSNPMAFNNLGLMHSSTGDTVGAIRAFEQALRVNPAFEAARINLEKARESQAE